MEASVAVVAPGRRLGKKPPKFDKRTLRLADYVKARVALPKVPDSFDLTKRHKGLKGLTYPMFANNRLGDCTAAALAHMEQVTSRGSETPTEDKVIAFYSRVTGYDPATGAHDDGAYLLDCLNAASKPEYELDHDPIGPFVAVDPMRDDLLRFALWAFGGAYIGVNLPVTAQSQDKVWSYVPATNGNEPGSWGGHAVNLLPKATKTKTTCVTWGATVVIEEEFRHRYNDEVFAYIDSDWIATAHGGKVHGLDMAGLLSDLAAIKR